MSIFENYKMELVDNNYIKEAVHSLYNTIGIKLPMSDLSRFINGDVRDRIEHMAVALGLPVKITVNFSTNFYSTALAESGNGGITAQVNIPSNLPMYGSKELTGLPIHIRISGDFSNHPYTFASIIAHELSHILLYSLRNQYKDSEIHTDLCAIMMGFSYLIGIGRTMVDKKNMGEYIQTTTHTYGYLSDNNFRYAERLIDEIRCRHTSLQSKIRDCVNNSENLISKIEARQSKLNKLIGILHTHPRKKIISKDAQNLVALHNCNHNEDIVNLISMHKTSINKCKGEILTRNYFMPRDNALFESKLKECDLWQHELDGILSRLQNDQDAVLRNISFWQRITLRYPLPPVFQSRKEIF